MSCNIVKLGFDDPWKENFRFLQIKLKKYNNTTLSKQFQNPIKKIIDTESKLTPQTYSTCTFPLGTGTSIKKGGV